ncbi:hypothetical protein [Legionella drancourtii]|uniref:hypothetical protein n=1 Tax=Legionella drancourtii TaxID=168933 RepID=UPI0002F1A917|nr:hypothetical protein [Legionella drancourtii]
MKRVIPSLLLLPLLTSCVVQEGYYEPGYYPPPPPYVEIHRYDEHRHEHHQTPGYRPAPQARVYQGQVNNHANAPIHGNHRPGGQAVVVSPQQPQPQTRPMPLQSQPQAQVQPNAHGHGRVNGPTAMPPAASGSKTLDQQHNVEGHN